MDPRRLLTFREVAHQGSFSRAGEALALTQPAVSQQVAALERQLGRSCSTAARAGRHRPPAGALLLAHADAVADRLAQADAQIAELAAAERETLRVGAFPSALATAIPEAIVRLRTRHPDLQVEAIEASGEELGAMVAAGELHAACASRTPRAPPRGPRAPSGTSSAARRCWRCWRRPPAGRARPARGRATSRRDWTAPSRDHLIYRACVAAGSSRGSLRDPRRARRPRAVASGLAVTMMPELLAAGLPDIADDRRSTARSPRDRCTRCCRRPAHGRPPPSPSSRRSRALVASLRHGDPSTSQPTPQRLAAIREQLSLLSDYL